jgi:hypothetical protein
MNLLKLSAENSKQTVSSFPSKYGKLIFIKAKLIKEGIICFCDFYIPS